MTAHIRSENQEMEEKRQSIVMKKQILIYCLI